MKRVYLILMVLLFMLFVIGCISGHRQLFLLANFETFS